MQCFLTILKPVIPNRCNHNVQGNSEKNSPHGANFSCNEPVNFPTKFGVSSQLRFQIQDLIDNYIMNCQVSGLLIFCAVAEPRISTKSTKSREIHRNTRNPAKFARNLTKYISAQYIWKLPWLLGLLSCCKCANLPWNFVTAASEQHPKTTRCS